MVIDINLYTYFERKAGNEPVFGDCYFPVIQHEGVHAMVMKIFKNKKVPVWLNEGLACFYESMSITSVNKMSGSTTSIFDLRARQERTSRSYRPEQLKEYLKKNPTAPLNLKYLLDLNHDTWNADNMGPKTGFNYDISESFIDFMMDTQEGRTLLRSMVKKTLAGDNELMTEKEMVSVEAKWFRFLESRWKVRTKK
jgi:hypothetical protein